MNTPDIPALTVNAPMEFSLSAQPDDDFTLSIKVDDSNSIKIEPSSLTFLQRLTNQSQHQTLGYIKLNIRLVTIALTTFQYPL